MALFTRTAKLDPEAHGARCAWAMVVHHAVGISRQRNSGYRPSRVNIMAQGLSILSPSLSPTHLSVRRGRATTTHYTHHQVSLMVSRNTTLVPYLGLDTGPACEAGLSVGMRRERVPPQRRKKKRKRPVWCSTEWAYIVYTVAWWQISTTIIVRSRKRSRATFCVLQISYILQLRCKQRFRSWTIPNPVLNVTLLYEAEYLING